MRTLLGGESEGRNAFGWSEVGSVRRVSFIEKEKYLLISEMREDLRIEGTESLFVLVNIAYDDDNLCLLHGTETALNT